jgi:two-component system, NarL family, response regulator DevR
MRRLRVLVADDHQLMIDAVRAAFAADADDIEVVGEATSTADVLSQVPGVLPDVVLLDIGMPGSDGLSCLRTLRALYPKVKVIMLSGNDNDAVKQTAMRLGASAFVSKLVDPRDLASVVRQVVEGTVVVPPPLASPLGLEGLLATLTEADRRVLGMLASGDGTANREIGRRLGMSEQAVKYHLSRIYRKLGVNGRVEAARIAYSTDLELDS